MTASAEDDDAGAAERDVGRYIYRRIEVLMDAVPDTEAGGRSLEGRELDYLATIVSAVEEYGAENCGGDDLSTFSTNRKADA